MPEVVEAMTPFFRDKFANASSIDHVPGAAARRAVDEARDAVAMLVGAMPEDVIFTSGATESNNIVLSTAMRVLTTPVEHPSVLDPFRFRARNDDVLLDIDSSGRVDADRLRERLAEGNGALVSVIATNNEIGTEQDIELLADVAQASNSLLHLDATQAVGTRYLNIARTKGIAGISISAHKIHGPKGIGALIATSSLRRAISPVMRGGGHERGYRSGTLNVPAIVGFGVAARLANAERSARRERLKSLRLTFLEAMCETLGDRVTETIPRAPVSPHILSLRLRGTNGRALLRSVREEIAFSLGSACATNKAEPSHVLLALGLEKRAIAETIRISFSAEQPSDEVARAATILAGAARELTGYSLSA